MRWLSVRLIVSLIVGITLVSLAFTYREVQRQKLGLRKDLERSDAVLGESLAGYIEPYLEKQSPRQLQKIVDRFGNREGLEGMAIYDKDGALLAATSALTRSHWQAANACDSSDLDQPRFGPIQLALGRLPFTSTLFPAAARRSRRRACDRPRCQLHQHAEHAHVEGSFRKRVSAGSVDRADYAADCPVESCRAHREGRTVDENVEDRKGQLPSGAPDLDLLRPLAREMQTFAASLMAARSAAEAEAHLRETADSIWTAERLAVHVRSKLGDSGLVVVSNREPYSHTRKGESLEVVVPPSGLVTALEPILCACDGKWVAHGSGDADRETVDANAHLRVPPDDPKYTLRRVWLTKEEEEGYYFGFSNEGLWPLCHIAHTRPIFRTSDWESYREVNQKFADAALEEMADFEQPLLLVQDYHFALLPRLVKRERPDARVAIFWHIPWPNAEAFGICPWQRELIDGMLGADLIGFHIQSHCNNFLQTVDRTLESRIDWEHFAINREDHRTVVKPFPISVDFREISASPRSNESPYTERVDLLRGLGVNASFLGVGVDRVDYTKGILGTVPRH